MKNIISIALTLLILALSGCGPTHHVPAMPKDDLAAIKLAESAHSVSLSLVELARIQAEATPPVEGHHLPDPKSYEMREVASIDWSGPIGPAIDQIAHSSRYHLRVLGHPPAVPIIVTVIAKNVPLGTLLRDVAFQAGDKAKVMVYPKDHVIELRYAHA